MAKRGYQENFYNLYEKFQDTDNRRGKADKTIQMLLQHSGVSLDDRTCLDLGCSNGIFTSALAPLFKHVVGVDYDRTAIHLIPMEDRQKILFIWGDAMQLPFADETFEAVICAQVYEHVPDDLTLFSEMERILKPGGVVFFSGPNKLFPVEPHYYLPFLHWLPEKAADAYLRLLRKGDHFYERSRTPRNLRRVLQHFDIRDVSIPVVRLYAGKQKPGWKKTAYDLFSHLPLWLWKPLIPLLPNFNWILFKRPDPESRQQYEIIP